MNAFARFACWTAEGGCPYVSFVRLTSPEGRKLDQVVVGNPFHRVSGLAPGTQATRDYVHFESQLL